MNLRLKYSKLKSELKKKYSITVVENISIDTSYASPLEHNNIYISSSNIHSHVKLLPYLDTTYKQHIKEEDLYYAIKICVLCHEVGHILTPKNRLMDLLLNTRNGYFIELYAYILGQKLVPKELLEVYKSQQNMNLLNTVKDDKFTTVDVYLGKWNNLSNKCTYKYNNNFTKGV